MFTTITTIVRSAAPIAAAACLLSACGGGGEGLALKPACSSTSDGNVPICTTSAFQYDTGAADAAVANNAGDYTLTGTRTAAAETWGAVVGQLNLYDPQNASGYKSLKLSLASSSNTQVMLMLMSSGAKNGCYPAYVATGLSATAKNVTIPLTDFALAKNPDTDNCAKTTDPDTAVALTNVTGLQVREVKGTAGANAVNVVIGKPLLWSMELPVVVEPPTPTTTAVVVDYTYAGGFGPDGDTTKQVSEGGTTTFTDSGATWVLAGSRVAVTANWSTSLGVLHVNAQPTGDKNKTSLGFTLASGGNTEILIRLKASNYDDKVNPCTPTFKATELSTTAKALTVALSDFKSSNDITANCAAQTATALDLTNFDKIEITDRMETTGKTTINVTLSALNWVVAP